MIASRIWFVNRRAPYVFLKKLRIFLSSESPRPVAADNAGRRAASQCVRKPVGIVTLLGVLGIVRWSDKLLFSRRRGRPLDVPIVCSDSLHSINKPRNGASRTPPPTRIYSPLPHQPAETRRPAEITRRAVPFFLYSQPGFSDSALRWRVSRACTACRTSAPS